MKKLVNWYDGEPWFDNPQLIVANIPRKRRASMARTNRRRTRRHHVRQRARHNLYSPGPLVNRVHRRRTMRARARAFFRRHFRRRHHLKYNRRHYRRNPSRGLSLAGMHFPPLDAVLWVSAGVVVPPMITAQVMKYIPASWQQTQAATWLVKVASVVVPGILLRRFVNPRAGNLFMVGGLASLAVEAIRTYAPNLIPGMGYQPLLGAYFGPSVAAGRPRAALPPMISEAPTRLDPQHRF
jgi:hypothetical protein